VLDIQGDKALILTENIIEKRRYHSSLVGAKWVACDIHDYLNGIGRYTGKGFYDAFSSQEKAQIVKTDIITNNNPWFGREGSSRSVDRIFLLSIEEVVKYFGDSGQMINKNKKIKELFI